MNHHRRLYSARQDPRLHPIHVCKTHSEFICAWMFKLPDVPLTQILIALMPIPWWQSSVSWSTCLCSTSYLIHRFDRVRSMFFLQFFLFAYRRNISANNLGVSFWSLRDYVNIILALLALIEQFCRLTGQFGQHEMPSTDWTNLFRILVRFRRTLTTLFASSLLLSLPDWCTRLSRLSTK